MSTSHSRVGSTTASVGRSRSSKPRFALERLAVAVPPASPCGAVQRRNATLIRGPLNLPVTPPVSLASLLRFAPHLDVAEADLDPHGQRAVRARTAGDGFLTDEKPPLGLLGLSVVRASVEGLHEDGSAAPPHEPAVDMTGPDLEGAK